VDKFFKKDLDGKKTRHIFVEQKTNSYVIIQINHFRLTNDHIGVRY
jgi:hypothetical protein